MASHFTGLFGGVTMSLISFSIVFLVCTGLILLMTALKYFVNMLESKKASQAQGNAPAVTVAAPAPTVTASRDDDEIVAVITAAIVASCGTGARIVQITPAPPRRPSSPWSMNGRLQNFEGFAD